MTLAREPEEITTSFLDRLLAELKVTCGSLLLVDQKGTLVEILRRGMSTDPLAGAGARQRLPGRGDPDLRQPFIAAHGRGGAGAARGGPAGWRGCFSLTWSGFMAVPAGGAGPPPVGLVTAFADHARGPFEDEELELATAMGSNAATALANARAWRSLEQLNRSLEEAVAERTRGAPGDAHRAQTLAEQLEDRNLALEAANQELRGWSASRATSSTASPTSSTPQSPPSRPRDASSPATTRFPRRRPASSSRSSPRSPPPGGPDRVGAPGRRVLGVPEGRPLPPR